MRWGRERVRRLSSALTPDRVRFSGGTPRRIRNENPHLTRIRLQAPQLPWLLGSEFTPSPAKGWLSACARRTGSPCGGGIWPRRPRAAFPPSAAPALAAAAPVAPAAVPVDVCGGKAGCYSAGPFVAEVTGLSPSQAGAYHVLDARVRGQLLVQRIALRLQESWLNEREAE